MVSQSHLHIVESFLQLTFIPSEFFFCVLFADQHRSKQLLEDVLARAHPQEGVMQVKVLINFGPSNGITWVPVFRSSSRLGEISHYCAMLRQDECLTSHLINLYDGWDLFCWIDLRILFAHVFLFKHFDQFYFMRYLSMQAERTN